MNWRVELRRAVFPVLRGLFLLAALTALAFRFHLNSAAAACLDLIVIVVNCLDCGPWSAVVLSLAAVAGLDYFFIDPVFAFTVADPVDVAALGAFLTSSLIVSRLASRARQEAGRARSESRNLERLYELAQRLLSLDPLSLDAPALLDAIRKVFHLEWAAFFDAASAHVHTAGDPPEEFVGRTRDAYIASRDSDHTDRRTSFRQLRLAGKSIGAIGLSGLDEPRRMAGPLVALAVAGLERARTVRAEARASAEAQSEALRTAVLDALAHEFKTPLATILTAAGGLREAAPLPPAQAELAEIVETEAGRLSELSSRLLGLARLDREEVQPTLAPANFAGVVHAIVDRHTRLAPRHRIRVNHQDAPEYVLLDEGLYSLALTQLLDNACRYSPHDSPVEVKIESRDGFADVVVSNSGTPIPPMERDRIFERFYRGADSRVSTSGTGLGLYVARKIARAHRGRLELDAESVGTHSVAFRLSVPLDNNGASYAASNPENPDR